MDVSVSEAVMELSEKKVWMFQWVRLWWNCEWKVSTLWTRTVRNNTLLGRELWRDWEQRCGHRQHDGHGHMHSGGQRHRQDDGQRYNQGGKQWHRHDGEQRHRQSSGQRHTQDDGERCKPDDKGRHRQRHEQTRRPAVQRILYCVSHSVDYRRSHQVSTTQRCIAGSAPSVSTYSFIYIYLDLFCTLEHVSGRAFLDKLRVSPFPWCVPTLCSGSTFSPLRLRWVQDVCMFSCHVPFWQNDRDLLRATAVTQGLDGYQNKVRQHEGDYLQSLTENKFNFHVCVNRLSIWSCTYQL